jgi:hypothetical protein
VVVFPFGVRRLPALLTDDRPLLVQGKVQKDEKSAKILADSIIAMEDAESRWTAEVHFTSMWRAATRRSWRGCGRWCGVIPATASGWLHLKMAGNVETIIAMSEGWRIQPGDAAPRSQRPDGLSGRGDPLRGDQAAAVMATATLPAQWQGSDNRINSLKKHAAKNGYFRMNVPLLDLKAQYQTIREEIRTVIDEICDSQYFILGPTSSAMETKSPPIARRRTPSGCLRGPMP